MKTPAVNWKSVAKELMTSILLPIIVSLSAAGYLQHVQNQHSKEDSLVNAYTDQARQFQIFLAHYASAITQNSGSAASARQQLVDNLIQQKNALDLIALDKRLDHSSQVQGLESSLLTLSQQLPLSEDFNAMSKVWSTSSTILVQQNALLEGFTKNQTSRWF